MDLELDVERRVEPQLLECNRKHLAEVQPVGAPQQSPGTRQAVGKSEARREVVAVAIVRDAGEMVDFERSRHRLIAQAIVEGEVRADPPFVAGIKLQVPKSEAAMHVAD